MLTPGSYLRNLQTRNKWDISFMISLFNKTSCVLIELGKAFADGQNYMSKLFFFRFATEVLH